VTLVKARDTGSIPDLSGSLPNAVNAPVAGSMVKPVMVSEV
jgi:hypothetical protein